MKNLKITGLLILIFGVPAWASKDIVEIPEGCVQKMEFPCLVQADRQTDLKFNLKSGSEILTIYSETVVRLDASPKDDLGPISFELKKGQMKIKSQNSVKTLALIQEQELDIQKGVLVSRKNGLVQILNLEGLDYITLKPAHSPAYQVVSKKLQDRKEMLDYILSFSDTRSNLRKLLAIALKQHDHKTKSETVEQTKTLQRSVASEQAEKEKNAKASQKEEAERKKSRQLFFQRTFER